jgi:hypothetical protein
MFTFFPLFINVNLLYLVKYRTVGMPLLYLHIRKKSIDYTSVADPDPGSGIGCLFDPWIRDPGWEKVIIRIRDPG